MKHPPLSLLVLVAALALAGSLRAGDGLMFLPDQQPLAVIRIANPGNVERLLDSRLGRILGLADKDRSGRIPGFLTGPKSWRDFFDSLSATGAENFWYCLTQSGSLFAGQNAGMGWSWTDGQIGPESVTDWLELLGFDGDKLVAAVGGPKQTELLIAKDQQTMVELVGKGRPDHETAWAKRLRSFMLCNPGGAGAWFYPRPGFGMIALATGVDIRSLTARLGMNAPSSAYLDVFPAGDAFGLDLVLEGLFPAPIELSDDAEMVLLPDSEPPEMARFAFAGLRDYLAAFGLDRNILFPVNMDLRAFLPRTATLTVWRDGAGTFHWNLVSLMGDKERFRRQWKRLVSWLEVLSGSHHFPLRTDEIRISDGLVVRRVESSEHTAYVGMAETELHGDDGMLLLASGAVEDFPDAGGITTRRCQPALVNWKIGLGPASRLELSETLAGLLAMSGLAAPVPAPADLATVFPESEEGGIRIQDDGLLLSSPRGMAAWLVPSLAALLREHVLLYP